MIVHSVKFTRFPTPPKPPCPAPKLVLRTPAAPAPEKVGLLTKMGRLRRELTKWAAAGAPLASKEVRQARLAICQACPGNYYNPSGNLGLGECKAPGCGCTRVKLALATARCPQGHWPALTPA